MSDLSNFKYVPGSPILIRTRILLEAVAALGGKAVIGCLTHLCIKCTDLNLQHILHGDIKFVHRFYTAKAKRQVSLSTFGYKLRLPKIVRQAALQEATTAYGIASVLATLRHIASSCAELYKEDVHKDITFCSQL